MASAVSAAEIDQKTVKEIVDRVDRLYRSKTSKSDVEMEITTPEWTRTLKMDVWTEGLDKTFVRILYPKKDEGIATLRVENEMWNYFPKINKVMKVPPSMMTSSWMGSDFTNDDLVKESSLLEDYTYKLLEPEGADPNLHYVELTPRVDSPVVWAKIVMVVMKNSYIPVREEYYDDNGVKVRIMTFSDIKDFGGRRVPAVITLTPLSERKKGHKTVIIYKTLEFDAQLPEDVFSLRNLRSH